MDTRPVTEQGQVPTTSEEPELTEAVFAAPDPSSAELVRSLIEAEGIVAVIGEQVTGAYSGPFSVGEGFWGEVRVPHSDAERARALVASFQAGGAAVSDEELTAQAESASDPGV